MLCFVPLTKQNIYPSQTVSQRKIKFTHTFTQSQALSNNKICGDQTFQTTSMWLNLLGVHVYCWNRSSYLSFQSKLGYNWVMKDSKEWTETDWGGQDFLLIGPLPAIKPVHWSQAVVGKENNLLYHLLLLIYHLIWADIIHPSII